MKMQEAIYQFQQLRQDTPENYLDSSMWHSLAIPIINQAFPGSKFIHLTRNVWDWIISAWRRGWYHAEAESHNGDYVRTRIEPVKETGDRWFKLGFMYRFYDNCISQGLQHAFVEYLRLDLRDLDDLETMNAVAVWCGFPPTITEKVRANIGTNRIQVEDIRARNLPLKVPEGYHPHAWYPEEKVGYKYERIHKFTPELVKSVSEGMRQADREMRYS